MKTLFISNEKRRLLFGYILSKPEEQIKIRKIASELHLAPGFVSSFVKKLKENGFVKDGKVDLGSPRVRAWKALFNVETLSHLVPELVRHTKARGVGVYGSWAKGTNTESSDVDIWITAASAPDAVAIARARNLLRRATGKEIGLLVLTPDKLKELRKSDQPFYFSLVNSLHLGGEQLD